MKKIVEIELDVKTAKTMLGVAGFSTANLSEDEIFQKVMEMITPYGVDYRTRDWIPCDGKVCQLPNEGDRVLVDNGIWVGEAKFEDGRFDAKNVIAWQKLPESYQAKPDMSYAPVKGFFGSFNRDNSQNVLALGQTGEGKAWRDKMPDTTKQELEEMDYGD